jgi:biopolymer transport protein TolR
LGQDKVAPAELGGKIRDKLTDKPGKQIFVRADARAKFLDVENAIDDVRSAGVESVGLLTEKRQTPGLNGE